MSRQERLALLADFVIERGAIHVEDAVRELGVSSATIRRDLETLADQQLIVRTRGGAAAKPASGDLPLKYRVGARNEEKNAIARAAASFIEPREVIGFNGGTTTTLAAQEIGVRVASEENFHNEHITLVTNSINIANDLAIREQVRVVVTGGVVRGRSYELIGPLSALILPHIKIDTLFLGVDGLDPEHAVYSAHEGEAEVSAAFAKAARRVIVLADSTKLGKTAFATMIPMSHVDTVITDSNATPQQISALKRSGTNVIIAQ